MRYEAVIIGSGYFSIGYALAHPSCLIIERAQILDPNFGGTFSGFTACTEDPTVISTPLATHFSRNGFLKNGVIHANLSEIALSSFVAGGSLPILLGTEVTRIRRTADGFKITYMNAEGTTEIEADRLFDTRDNGDKRSLNVLCLQTAENLGDLPECGGFTVSSAPAFYDGEVVLRFRFDQTTECNQAKAAAMRYFEKHGDGLGLKPIKFAYRTFSENESAEVSHNGAVKINELAMGDPFAAFEYGSTYANKPGTAEYFPTENTSAPEELGCDILCVGAGAAGCYAAIAAAREGARVILLEKDVNVGGMPVNGQVCFFYYGEKGGSYGATEKRCATFSGLFAHRGKHPDALQAALTEAITASGAVLMTESTIESLCVTDGRLTRVTAHTPNGKINIRFGLLIDATSDGHVIRMCPQIKTYLGRDSDGTTVPFTVRTELVNDGGCYHYNGDDGYCNQYRQPEYSQKIIAARARRLKLVRKGHPRVLSIATTAGFREGIRFEGRATLGYKDIIMGEPPEKTLFVARSDLDKHGHDHALDDELYQNWWIISNLATVTARIYVPLGAVVPTGISGIVTAGRCLSIDSYASSAVRMNRDMHRMGECVGIAAALAVRDGVEFTDIDYAEYRKITDSYDCRNGVLTDRFAFDSPNGTAPYRQVSFRMSDGEIIEALATDSPGEAIWTCFRSDGSIAEKLIPLLRSENRDLALHAAFALGIMGRKEALPQLRQAIAERNTDFLRGCRRSNQLKCTVALCLIGRLGEADDVELLMPFFTENEQKRELYAKTVDLLVSRNENYGYTYFQFFTFALTAVGKLAVKYGKEKEIYARLQGILTAERLHSIGMAVSLGDIDSHVVTALNGVVQKITSMLTERE